MAGPKSVQVKLNLHFFEITGTWEPNNAERNAAWELYVELVTRVVTVPLAPDEGLLREAMTSFYSLFGSTREILRRYGPDVAQPKPKGQYSFGYLAVAMLNLVVRPVLARWHPELEQWEHRRTETQSIAEHERAWEHATTVRAELEATRSTLGGYAATFATACGVPDLSAELTASGQRPAF